MNRSLVLAFASVAAMAANGKTSAELVRAPAADVLRLATAAQRP